jgi:hypothetical protein
MIRTSEPFLVFLIFLVLRTLSFFLVVFESKIYLAGPALTVPRFCLHVGPVISVPLKVI